MDRLLFSTYYQVCNRIEVPYLRSTSSPASALRRRGLCVLTISIAVNLQFSTYDGARICAKEIEVERVEHLPCLDCLLQLSQPFAVRDDTWHLPAQPS